MDRNQKKDFWHNHIEECSKSNLSQVDYCVLHKIPSSTFSYCKRKLRENNSKPVFYPIALSSDQSSFQEQKETNLILHLREG